MAQRALSAFDSCTIEERERGLDVWRWMSNWCREVSQEWSVTMRVCCGVMAATSPNNSWRTNMNATISILGGQDDGVATYTRDVIKALWILAGADPETVLAGPKTCSFYRLLYDSGNSWDVCVDGHIANLLKNELRPLTQSTLSRREFEQMAEAIREAARCIGWRPCDLQGALWLAWRSSDGFRQGRL